MSWSLNTRLINLLLSVRSFFSFFLLLFPPPLFLSFEKHAMRCVTCDIHADVVQKKKNKKEKETEENQSALCVFFLAFWHRQGTPVRY